MKPLLYGATFICAAFATSAPAADVLDLNEDLSVSELMDRCSSAEGGSEAQLKCFELLAQVIKQQESGQSSEESGASPIVEKLEALRSLAQYQDSDSGLSISGNGCLITIYYYGNYYRISRRNVSSVDLFYTQFNASKLMHRQTQQMQGPALTWLRGVMENGSTAVSRGGQALESTTHNFASKSANETIGEYAAAVVNQLSPREEQTFDFVLVHPKRAQANAEIMSAFASFIDVCQA